MKELKSFSNELNIHRQKLEGLKMRENYLFYGDALTSKIPFSFNFKSL